MMNFNAGKNEEKLGAILKMAWRWALMTHASWLHASLIHAAVACMHRRFDLWDSMGVMIDVRLLH